MKNSPTDQALSAAATARLKSLEQYHRASQELKRAEESIRSLDLTIGFLTELRKKEQDATQ